MDEHSRESLEAMNPNEQREEYTPKTPFQRVMAWIAIAVVLFGLGGTIYWMMAFRG